MRPASAPTGQAPRPVRPHASARRTDLAVLLQEGAEVGLEGVLVRGDQHIVAGGHQLGQRAEVQVGLDALVLLGQALVHLAHVQGASVGAQEVCGLNGVELAGLLDERLLKVGLVHLQRLVLVGAHAHCAKNMRKNSEPHPRE
jgi:hypothetical protein